MEGTFGALLVIVVFVAAYMIPAYIAAHREHHNSTAILLLNILLGWTLLGWVAALIWATTAVQSPPPE